MSKQMIHFTDIRTASLGQLTDELAAAGWDSTQTDIHDAREAVARLVAEVQTLGLYDCESERKIREASGDEAAASIAAGDEGFILVDGVACYVA